MPNGAVHDCTNCHISVFGGGPRTPFGEAVNALVAPGSLDTFWSPSLAAADSDRDGVSNGEELLDPAGTWSPGDPDPGDPADVTNPGDPDDPPPPEPSYVRGDINADGIVNIADAVFGLNFQFAGGPRPPCRRAADANNDGGLDLSDYLFVLNFLFLPSPAPPAPFPDCGADVGNSGGLSCDSFAPCS